MTDHPIEVGRIEARQVVRNDGAKESEVWISDDLPAETAAWLLLQLAAVVTTRYVQIEENTDD